MGAEQLVFLWYTMAWLVMVALVWWMGERAIDHLRRRYVVVRPAPVPYVEPDEAPEPADEQTDTQTDPVSAHYDAIGRLRVDRSRAALVEVLVLAGWDVGRIRGAIKGDNGVIGTEVGEARLRLGLDAPTRTIKVTERVDGKPQTREVAL